MQSFSTQGIVLKRRNFGEGDRIVTFFTRNRGKVAAVAKGVRKVTSRRAPNIELLNHTNIFLHATRGLPILTEASEIESFPQLKNDLEKLSFSYIALELVDQFLEAEQEHQEVFDLLLGTLRSMEKAENAEKAKLIQNSFQIKFLTSVGFLPQLYKCVRCEKALAPENIFLSPHLGGLIDEACSRETLMAKLASVDSVKTLRFLEAKPLALVEKLALNKKILQETSNLLNFYTTFFLEKELATLAFANQVDKLL